MYKMLPYFFMLDRESYVFLSSMNLKFAGKKTIVLFWRQNCTAFFLKLLDTAEKKGSQATKLFGVSLAELFRFTYIFHVIYDKDQSAKAIKFCYWMFRYLQLPDEFCIVTGV